MPKKLSVKKVIEYCEKGFSQRMIAETLSMSRNSVTEILAASEVVGIGWENIKEMEENEVYRLLFPNKFQQSTSYATVDYAYVHKELKRTGVTLKLLWNEYCINCEENKQLPCGYTKFCNGYKDYCNVANYTSHIVHKPGIAVEVDYAGDTIPIVNPDTGEIIECYLFVGTLPYSQFTYCEAALNMKQDNFIKCHVNMFNYFGGVPIKVVCDNLKTGVISHPKIGEIILNKTYEEMADHYSVAIMPARPVRPKDKPSAEGSVNNSYRAIYAKLRNTTFNSLNELNNAIWKRLEEFNNAPFEKREGSRKLIFENEEKELLQKLPKYPFEVTKWEYAHKVAINAHIVFKKNYYSVPYQYTKKIVDVKYTSHTLEIYFKSERIATHPRFPEYAKNKYSTIDSHMDERKKYSEWDEDRIMNWASKIGVNTTMVISKILDSVKIKEQGFNSALAVLNLSKAYEYEVFDETCKYALANFNLPRYKHIKTILGFKQESKEKKSLENENESGYVRGSDYYGGEIK